MNNDDDSDNSNSNKAVIWIGEKLRFDRKDLCKLVYPFNNLSCDFFIILIVRTISFVGNKKEIKSDRNNKEEKHMISNANDMQLSLNFYFLHKFCLLQNMHKM